MNFSGDYKLTKMMTCVEDDSEKPFVMISIDEVIEKTEDEHEKQQMEMLKNTVLTVAADGAMTYHMPIPEGSPADEIEEARAKGLIDENGEYIVERQQGKIENDALYLYDKNKFFTGEEWVKISTDVEGELKMFTSLYEKIK